MTMRWFRKQTKTFLWVVMAGFVAWILFELGADIFRLNVGGQPYEQGVVAEVDGEPVTYEVYTRALQQALEDSAKAWGREVTPRDRIQIAEAVWTDLLTQIRLQKLVQERGLSLSDPTVLELIRRIPPPEIQQDSAFWDSTGFNYPAYLSLLQNPQAAPFFVNYEMRLRREIPQQITWTDFATAVLYHPEELRPRAVMENTLMQASVFRFVYDRLPDSAVSYTEDDLKAYYARNRERYRQKTRVQLLVVEAPFVPSPEDSALAREKIQAALDELREGRDFAEVARYYAEVPQLREREGLMGVFPRNAIPLPDTLQEKLLTAEPGEIVGPLVFPPGYALFRWEPRGRDSVAIHAIAVAVEPSSTTRENLYLALSEFVESTPREALDSLAGEKGFRTFTTPLFPPEGGYIPQIGARSDLLSWLERAKPGDISPVVELPSGFGVALLTKMIPEGIPPLDSVKDRVERDLVRELKKEKAMALVDSARKLLQEGKAFEEVQEALTAYRPEVIHTPKFRLRQPVPGLGLDLELASLIYGLPADSSVHGPFALERAVYLIQKTLHEPPADTTLDVQGYAQRRAQLLLQVLIRDIQRELGSPKGVKDYRPQVLKPVS